MILMYHHIVPAESIPPGGTAAEDWRWVHSTENVRAHITNLRKAGRIFVSLDDYVSDLLRKGSPSPEFVHVTVDDGWAEAYHHALELFEELSVPWTMFVTTKYLHGEEDGGRLVTPDQLVEMQSRGVTIGAHSHSHRGLTTLAETERRDEISSCKRLLEALLGKEVKWFA